MTEAEIEGLLNAIGSTGKALGKILPTLLRHPPTDNQSAGTTIEKLDGLFHELEAAGNAQLSSRDNIDSIIAAALVSGLIEGLVDWRSTQSDHIRH